MISSIKKFSSITTLNIITQIVALIGFIYVSKVISPELLGQYIIFLTYISIFSLLSTCFYEQSLYIDRAVHERKEELGNLLSVSFILFILMISSLSIFGLTNAVAISLSSFFSGIKVISRTYAIVKGDFVKLSIAELLSAPVIPISILLLIGFKPTANIEFIIAIYVITNFFISIGFLCFFVIDDVRKLREFLPKSKQTVLTFIKRYKKLLVFKTPTELINALCLRIPVFIIEKYFSLSTAAFYGIAFRVLLSPVSIVISTISQLFIHKVSSIKDDSKKVLKVLWYYIFLLSVLALLGALLIYFVSKPVIIFIFSNEYLPMVEMLKHFIPYFFYLVVVTPLLSVFVVYERQEELLYSNLCVFVLSIISYSFAVYDDDILTGIILFSVSIFSVGILQVFRMVNCIKTKY